MGIRKLIIKSIVSRGLSQKETAQKVMKYLKDGETWIPKQVSKHCDVVYKKTGEFNGFPMFEKIVTRNNGTTVTGHFVGASCSGVIEQNARGRIDTCFGSINYDKVIQIDTAIGDSFVRLGHKNNPARYVDNYKLANDFKGTCGENQELFEKLLRTIRNPES